MAINLDLFSSNNYQQTIRRYCNQLGWTISDINDRRTIIKFSMDSGTTQTAFIIRYDTTLEFSYPSGLKFDTQEDVPGWLSTLMLCENATYKVGFWCIENIDNRQVLSMMHNAEISLIDVNYFQKVVMQTVTKCDQLEQNVSKALRGY
ncbi:MAG: hypothetical protein AUK48_12805 [Oscillatoriales cyanobacterium CG2_30_44_21]|nr:MAG: hypothetical protein AUK48_12805 [Oscillatoriales cyanobacterium CG2_30_44_21]